MRWASRLRLADDDESGKERGQCCRVRHRLRHISACVYVHIRIVTFCVCFSSWKKPPESQSVRRMRFFRLMLNCRHKLPSALLPSIIHIASKHVFSSRPARPNNKSYIVLSRWTSYNNNDVKTTFFFVKESG